MLSVWKVDVRLSGRQSQGHYISIEMSASKLDIISHKLLVDVVTMG